MNIGSDKSALDTPALWVDLDLMERNIVHLSELFRQAGVAWRPHIKGIKVAEVAQQLLDAGAIGVTCAKLSEAEVMAAAGIRDILIARHHAGARVFATTSTAEKAQRAKGLGATDVFNYREEDWVSRTLEATDGRGVDLVQDNVGAATWSSALQALAPNGRLVTCGSRSGPDVALNIRQIYHRQLRIIGSNGGTYQDLASALALVEQGHIRPVVDTVLPLEEIQEGHRLLEEGEHFGKVVIRI